MSGFGDEPSGDVDLPRSTVATIMKESLPENTRISNEAKDLVQAMAVEFVRHIGAGAMSISEAQGKNIIMPDHLMAALSSKEFGQFGEMVRHVGDESKAQATVRSQRSSKHKLKASGLTEEQLLAEQERIYSRALAAESMESHLDHGERALAEISGAGESKEAEDAEGFGEF